MDKKESIKNAIKLLTQSLTMQENYTMNIDLSYAVEWIIDAITKDVNK